MARLKLTPAPIEPPRGAVALNPAAAGVMTVSEVYFVLAPKSRLVKIGYARNAWSRMLSMQVGAPEELRLMATIATYLPIELELDLHTHFATDRVRGEWFRLTDEMVDYALKYDGSSPSSPSIQENG